MLIEFSLQNFRSFREKQTFSMVASQGTADKDDGRYAAASGNAAAPFVLRQACLFGANGSGKSALILAMGFMSKYVRESCKTPEVVEGCHPFLFHSAWRDAPSEFEAVFLHDGSLFQYGFAVSRERVQEEWLFERPNSTGRLRQIFTREYDSDKETYLWDISPTHLKGARESWRTQTRDDALFLTTAVQLNADALKRPFDWLVRGLRPIRDVTFLEPYTASRFDEEDWKPRVLAFLGEVGLEFADIEVTERDLQATPDFQKLPEQARALVPKDAKVLDVQTFRHDETGAALPLDIEEESSGTRGLFQIAGPILDTLEHGYTLVVDELNMWLHPLAFRHITEIFCDPARNPHGAQLIFSTHDATVADGECLHRDQIWMVEKSEDYASQLKPFSDFKTRDARPFRKDYLQGRFGAVPRLAG